MKMRDDFYNSSLICFIMRMSLACLLFVLSTIIAKPTVDEIGTRIKISNRAIDETCLPLCNSSCFLIYPPICHVNCNSKCQCWDPYHALFRRPYMCVRNLDVYGTAM